MRLLEHYVSVQGEGPKTGTPTQFVRFAGCNLRCPGWPCDTDFAIDPKKWRREYEELETKDIVEKVIANRHRAKNICLTGGEPLLQRYEDLVRLASVLHSTYTLTVEMFTNGSLEIPEKLAQNCTFVMDWKLPGSGENFSLAYRQARKKNLFTMATFFPKDRKNAIKFVCKDRGDLDAASKVYWHNNLDNWPGDVYFGAVWNSDYTTAHLVTDLMDTHFDWKLNIQSHNYIWSAQERGR